MNYVSLFSGIEAASCAWENLDLSPVLFSEIDPYPRKCLEISLSFCAKCGRYN